ncbi:hypothetical protein [Gordonia sp. NPDC003429]
MSTITSKITSRRVAAAVAGVAIAGGLATAGVGAAHAGTMPINRPGEPTTAMTITNHTDRYEWLVSSTPGSGQWVNAPQQVLAPGATEVVTANAPMSPYLTSFVNYRVGAFGPIATYNVANIRGDVNTAMTGVNGQGSGQYWINANVATGHPNVNVSYNLW